MYQNLFLYACGSNSKSYEQGHKRLTLKYIRDLALEVHQRWDVVDAVLLGLLVVVDLNEVNPSAVTLVVNVLQLGNHLLAAAAVLVV